MKILFVSQLYPPLVYGGGEYIFSKWAEELVKKGHKVTVITQNLKGSPKNEKINGVNVLRVGPKIEYKGSLYAINTFQNFGFLLSAMKKIILIRKKFDIIHANTYIPALSAWMANFFLRKPLLFTVHDVYLQDRKDFWKQWAKQKEVPKIVSLVGGLLEKIILKLPRTMIHTVSKTSEEDIIKTGVKKQRIVVIPNGLNLTEYDKIKSPKNKKNQIYFVGRLIFYKNIDTVIKSMKLILKKVPNTKFIISGKGPYEDKLKEIVKQEGLEKNIIFTGRVSDEQKIKYLKESDIMVQPSLVEGFGITIIESFACKTPVISSNVMPLPELVKDGINGYVCKPFDEKEWAEKIALLLKDKNKIRKLGDNARKIVEENYTIQVIVKKLERLYNRLL